MTVLKKNIAAGIYDVLVEQLKNLGPKAHIWLLTMLNKCCVEKKIATIWSQSNIIAILSLESTLPLQRETDQYPSCVTHTTLRNKDTE